MAMPVQVHLACIATDQDDQDPVLVETPLERGSVWTFSASGRSSETVLAGGDLSQLSALFF
jgi:hypothetical protein